ncbi:MULTISPECIES: hypothetical protein [Komagataeibacter]|uniref:UrcA family protein n=2 Tax=Komagataeibacter TaxID=1434011 RepID=A0ABS5SM52_9PROT|nr:MULTISPECIES: hypothetical protein [Komagataeibacter]MBL7232589.1 hypothetical protein [Komagataeibacter oboediens]MBT0675246.1 hypothetical protein [Komagataeibacter oboediens]MBT0678857.1 hypothetical protein [Komagataeibacter oboediens]MBV1823005.1 hypothetical protein [Komagataeibacter oboediens]
MKTILSVLPVLWIVLMGAPALGRTHRIHVPTTERHPRQVNTEFGHFHGHTAALPPDSSEYRNIDAKCSARGLDNVTSQSVTVGVSMASRRNFYAQCMVESGAWH